MTRSEMTSTNYPATAGGRAVARDNSLTLARETPALIAVVLALVCGWLASQLIGPFQVTVGQRDDKFLTGVHDVEQIDSHSGRWTTGAGEWRLPRSQAGQPALLRLSLLNARPADQPPPAVQVTVDDRALTRLTVDATLTGSGRQYHLLLPAAAGATATIGLASDTVTSAADPRPLGVFVRAAALEPAATGGLRLPPPLIPVTLVAFALLAYAALRGISFEPRSSGLIAATLVVALALGSILRPLDVLPFLVRVALLAGLACLTVWLARFVAPPELVAGRWQVQRADIGIYMGLAWWAMPVFQLIMTADGAEFVTPAPATTWIGAAAAPFLALVLGMTLYRRLRGTYEPQGPRPLNDPRTILLLALLIAALAHTAYLVWFAFQRSAPDFWIHFKAVRGFIRDGEVLYNIEGIVNNHFGFSYKWPPFYLVFLRPFIYYGGEHVLLGYRILDTLLLVATVLLLMREARSWQIAACLLLLLNFRPATDTMAFGQVDILMLFGFTVALLAARRNSDDLAGGILAVLTMIKVYPIVLFGLFFMQRRWRAFRGAIVAGLVYLLVSILTLGWEVHWIHLTQVMPAIGGGTAWVENQTFNGFASRLLATTIVADNFDHPLVALATYLFFALTAGLAMLLALKEPQRELLPRQFGLFVLLTAMAIPAAWMHYHTAAILAFAALLLAADERVPLGHVAALSAAYALIAYGNQWSFFNGEVLGGLSVLGYSYKFYGLLLLYSLTVVTIWPAPWPAWLQQTPIVRRLIPRTT